MNNVWDTLTKSLGLGAAGNILNWAIGVGSLLALGVIVYGGILYTYSAGRPSVKADAADRIRHAIYGLLLLLSAWLILDIINPALVGH